MFETQGSVSLMRRLLQKLRSCFAASPDLYLRIDRIDQLVGELKSMYNEVQEQTQIAHRKEFEESIIGHVIQKLDALTIRVAELGYAASFASKVGYNGDHENLLYRALVGSETPIAETPSPVPLSSSLCQQVHFTLDQYRYWVRQMRDRPKFMRKQWEFFFIAHALHEREFLRVGRSGIGFGVGIEPLPALFASFGAEIIATDQSFESAKNAGWVASHEHSLDLSALNLQGICDETTFRDLVHFAEVDMNSLPPHLTGRFDFCWSACALEHLGSLRHGIDFIKASLGVLRPGGVAVHTTEFNLSSDSRTIESGGLSVFRKRDIEQLIGEIEGDGHTVEPIDWTQGAGFAETVVDLPPFGRGEPHLRLLLGDFECTSIGLIVRKNSRLTA